MFSLFVIPAVLQIAVPIALLVWQAAGRDTNLISWFLKHGAVWCYIYATSIAGLWLIAPWYLPHVLLVISISLAARHLAGGFTLWRTPGTTRQWLALGARTSAALLGGAIVWLAVAGRKPPDATIVDLSFPLRSGEATGFSVMRSTPHSTALSRGAKTACLTSHLHIQTGRTWQEIMCSWSAVNTAISTFCSVTCDGAA